jgi:hypothetical protein
MAFAVVPSLASANPILTKPTGTTLATGSAIRATNLGIATMTTSLGNLYCSTTILEGTLTSNTTATGAKVEITSAKFGGTGTVQPGAEEPECTGEGFFTPNATVTPNASLPWCLEAAANAHSFTIRGGKCSAAATAIKFTLDVTGIGACEYNRTNAANGTLVTDGAGANENTGALTNQAWTLLSGFGCPSEVSLDVRYAFASGGAAAFISS